MIAQASDLNTILEHHGIHPKFWPEFRAYMEEGVRPGKELQTQLDHVANYQAAEKAALSVVSNPHTFPPANRRSPVPCESLRTEDIEPIIESEESVLRQVRRPQPVRQPDPVTQRTSGWNRPTVRGALIDGRTTSPPLKGQP